MANLGYLQVTRRCNQRCRFCSNPEIDVDLTPADGRARIDELADAGYDGVILTGGEPTLLDTLPATVAHAAGRGLAPRIVTNGQRLGDEPALLDALVDAGLRHVHLSLHSDDAAVVERLTRTPGSLARSRRALERLAGVSDRVAVDLNTVIYADNADHLDRHVRAVVERFGFVRHVVFNHLDVCMNRVAEHPDVVPSLWQFELSLYRALRWLERGGRSYRVERVPLCYMADHAHASTETRKLVKGEERTTHFLDDKGRVRQTGFRHDKAPSCRVCSLDPICAGLDGVGDGYTLDELSPVSVPAERVVARVLGVPVTRVRPADVDAIAARTAPARRQR